MSQVGDKILYWLYCRFTSGQQWRRRHVTASGQLLLASLLAAAVIGIDTNRTMTYQLFCLLAAIGLIAWAGCLFFRGHFTIRRHLPRYATCGEPLTYRLIIRNQGDTRQRGLFALDDIRCNLPSLSQFSHSREPGEEKRHLFDRLLKFRRWQWLLYKSQRVEQQEWPLPDIPPGGQIEVQLNLTPQRRGTIFFQGLTLARPDPFSLFRALLTIPENNSLLVLPKRYPLPPIKLTGRRQYQPGGIALASSIGNTQEFMALRDYRPGDPLRSIHWRSWAKNGKPIVQEFQDEYFVRHGLILDTFAPQSPAFEEAVAVAASFACTLLGQESLLDLLFAGNEAYCFTSGRSLGRSEQLLAVLAAVEPCPNADFHELHQLIIGHAGQLTSAICILLDWDGQRRKLIHHLRAIGIPVLALAITAEEIHDLADEEVHRLHPEYIEADLARL